MVRPIEYTTMKCITMKAFAAQLAEVRNLETKGKYKKSLDELETEYQFVLLHTLTHFHNEMRRSNLTEGLISSRSSFLTLLLLIQYTLPTCLSPVGIQTSRFVANANKTHCDTDSSQTNCAVRTAGSSNPWTA